MQTMQIEFSSPLAAMHPPPRPYGCRRQAANTFSAASFNFRDLSLKKSQPDYFTLKAQPVRGSSPTASLAADLSSNFHIDQRYVHSDRHCIKLAHNFAVRSSPHLADPSSRTAFLVTPLEEVRARHLLQQESYSRRTEGATTPPVRWEGVTTPPVPSSSPGFGSDPMDCSPLPHKPPFHSFIRKIEVQTTAAETTPTPDEDMTSPCDTTPVPLAQSQKNLQLPE
jgi:hypothetical protein